MKAGRIIAELVVGFAIGLIGTIVIVNLIQWIYIGSH
jgi:hypothetical protein